MTKPLNTFERYLIGNVLIIFALQEGIGAGIDDALLVVFFLAILCSLMEWILINVFTENKAISKYAVLSMVITLYVILLFGPTDATALAHEHSATLRSADFFLVK